jgi:hypothetical protein
MQPNFCNYKDADYKFLLGVCLYFPGHPKNESSVVEWYFGKNTNSTSFERMIDIISDFIKNFFKNHSVDDDIKKLWDIIYNIFNEVYEDQMCSSGSEFYSQGIDQLLD